MKRNIKNSPSQRQPIVRRLPLTHDKTNQEPLTWLQIFIIKLSTLKAGDPQKKAAKSTGKRNNYQEARHKRKSSSKITRHGVSVWLTRRIEINISVSRRPKKKARETALHEKLTKLRTNLNQRLSARGQTALATALIIIGVAGSLYFGWNTVMASPRSAGATTSVGSIKPRSEIKRTRYPRSTPTHLTIPDIGVDTALSTVGKTTDGSIQVPEDFHTAGWYKYSPTPGQIGPSVIVGHLDNVSGLAVFWRLHELKPGEMITVKRSDGRTLHFKVDAIRQFYQAKFPAKEVYGNIPYAGLRVITCGGTFNRITHEYDHNTVVYASLAT